MGTQLSNRLDRLEKVVIAEERPGQTKITRLSGAEAKQAEKKYILTMCHAALGLCEPASVIFISKQTKLIIEDYPGFPHRMTREDAKQLIEEYEK